MIKQIVLICIEFMLKEFMSKKKHLKKEIELKKSLFGYLFNKKDVVVIRRLLLKKIILKLLFEQIIVAILFSLRIVF